MSTWDWLTSKTFWAAAGLFGLALYQATQGQYEAAWQGIMAALGAIGLRHALAKEAASPPSMTMQTWTGSLPTPPRDRPNIHP